MSLKRRLERLENWTKSAQQGVIIYTIEGCSVYKNEAGKTTALTLAEYERDRKRQGQAGNTILIDDIGTDY